PDAGPRDIETGRRVGLIGDEGGRDAALRRRSALARPTPGAGGLGERGGLHHTNEETGPNRVLLLRTCPRIWNHEQRNGFRCHDVGWKTTRGQPGRPTISTRFGPLSNEGEGDEPFVHGD